MSEYPTTLSVASGVGALLRAGVNGFEPQTNPSL